MIDWKFVEEHLKDDVSSLYLKYMRPQMDSLLQEDLLQTILQIECRQRYSRKLYPLLNQYSRFQFPDQLSGEQASNILISRFHAMLASALVENTEEVYRQLPHAEDRLRLLDLTAGLGIDFIMISRAISSHGEGCLACELNERKAEALQSNLVLVGLDEAKVVAMDSVRVVTDLERVKLLFADPARRGSDNKRFYDPMDCQPDVIGNHDLLLRKAENVMIKNSPMMDIRRLISMFPGVRKVYVISIKNECKEVLIVASENSTFEGIECVDISHIDSNEELIYSSFKISSKDYSHPFTTVYLEKRDELTENDTYIYEPNVTVMKSLAWGALLKRFNGLRKLSPNCHVFCSKEYYPDFPGRILKISSIPEKKELKRLKSRKLNVVTRNYPIRPEQISSKYGIISGGNEFLYGVTFGSDEHPLLLVCKLQE